MIFTIHQFFQKNDSVICSGYQNHEFKRCQLISFQLSKVYVCLKVED